MLEAFFGDLFLITLQPHDEATLPPQDATTFSHHVAPRAVVSNPCALHVIANTVLVRRSLKEGTPRRRFRSGSNDGRHCSRNQQQWHKKTTTDQKVMSDGNGSKEKEDSKGRRNQSGRERQRAIVRRPVPQAVALPRLSESA